MHDSSCRELTAFSTKVGQGRRDDGQDLIIKIPTSNLADGLQLDADKIDRANCLEALRRLEQRAAPSDEQKNAADQVMPSPMG